MANVFNITLEYMRVMEMIEDNDGEITEEIEAAVNNAIKDRDTLMEELCSKYFETGASIQYIKSTIESFKARAEAYEKRQEGLKKLLLAMMVEFDMKKTTKGKTNYNFTSPLYTVFSKDTKSVEINEPLFIEKFVPITGETSKYVTYKVAVEVTADQLKQLNKLNIIPVSAMTPKTDKVEVKSYLEAIAEGSQLTFDGNDNIIFDPIKEVASIKTTTSVTIRR